MSRRLVASLEGLAASFDDVRIEDIARESGIPRATLYYYFSGKDEILAFLLEALLADYRKGIEELLAQGGSTRELLHGVVRTQLELHAARPGAVQLIQLNLGRIGKLPELAASAECAFLIPVVGLLERGVSQGELGECDPRSVAAAITGAVTFAAFHAALLDGGVDVERLADDLVRLLWDGMGTTAAWSALVKVTTL